MDAVEIEGFELKLLRSAAAADDDDALALLTLFEELALAALLFECEPFGVRVGTASGGKRSAKRRRRFCSLDFGLHGILRPRVI